MDVVTWAIILGLIGINALFVAAEFSAVSARRVPIRQRAERGNARARRLLPVLSDPHALDRYIAATQIGITLSSLVLGAYGQATLAPVLAPLFERLDQMQQVAAHSTATVVVLVGLTILQMVLGELVPKSIALQYPTQTALWTVVPMQWSLKLLTWFIAVLNGSGKAMLRLLRVREAGHGHIHSPEEIELLIAESRDGGLLEPDEQRRLQHALRLGSRPVRELMVPRPKIRALDVESTHEDLVRAVLESPFTRLPIYEDSVDFMIGLVHARDVATSVLTSDERISIRSILRPALIVPQSMTADRLLLRMREESQQMAIVADEFGGTAGLITADDIFGDLLGDVGDEFKASTPGAERLPDGRVRLLGSLRLDRAAQWIGIQWDGGSATIAGHITKLLRRLPAAGETFIVDGVAVEVEAIDRHTIASIVATPVSHTEETNRG